ncbi:hypothetical protein CDV31_017013 [Fusarium ambrosium]|uniref:Uncharacterized protein n=1 Tax=Fusarium ambrosium TaxID=131363 RepID=A0A428RW08_9HYPO|nr:hypothetical protein CDV31_017013 [Fusarium ambrosium]
MRPQPQPSSTLPLSPHDSQFSKKRHHSLMADADIELCRILQSLAQQTCPQGPRDERRARVADGNPSWWKSETMKGEPGWRRKQPRLADHLYYEMFLRLQHSVR